MCSPFCKEHLKEICGVRIGLSEIHGFGVFACRTFEVGDRICIYLGDRLTVKEFETKYEKKDVTCAVALKNVDCVLMADQNPLYGPGRYINHSQSKCNVEFVTRVYDDADPGVEVLATKRILATEEILVDYGESYWKKGPSSS